MGAQNVIQCHQVSSNLKKMEENMQKEAKILIKRPKMNLKPGRNCFKRVVGSK